MCRKVIFLDIDGVLNDHSKVMKVYCGIHRHMVDHLNKIINATDCYFVLSSAWRYMLLGGEMTLKGFEYLLITHGAQVNGRFIAYTIGDESIPSRGQQIASWLKTQGERFNVVKYVVLDDLDLNITDWGHPFVQTDGEIGLTDADADRVISILNGVNNGNR